MTQLLGESVNVTAAADPALAQQNAAEAPVYRITIDPDSIGRRVGTEQFTGRVPFGVGDLMVRAFHAPAENFITPVGATSIQVETSTEVTIDTPPPEGSTSADAHTSNITDIKLEKD